MATTRATMAAMLIALMQACAQDSMTAREDSVPPSVAAIADFYCPRFKSGLPTGNETLEEVLAEPLTSQLEAMRETVAVLNAEPTARASVVGHTDNSECQQLACEELSLRRARLVRNWLLRAGVRDSQLESASGGGSRVPLAFNTTNEGRATNRRVEINLL